MIVSVRQWVPSTARFLNGFLTERNQDLVVKEPQPSVGFFESWQKMWEHQTALVVRKDD
jgi:hypothetical protein